MSIRRAKTQRYLAHTLEIRFPISLKIQKVLSDTTKYFPRRTDVSADTLRLS